MDATRFINCSENAAVYDFRGHNMVEFHERHKLDHIMANVWRNLRDFCEILITYFDEKNYDLTHLWKKLH